MVTGSSLNRRCHSDINLKTFLLSVIAKFTVAMVSHTVATHKSHTNGYVTIFFGRHRFNPFWPDRQRLFAFS